MAEVIAPARSSTRLIVIVLALGTATFAMGQSVVSPILSTLQRDLHTSQGMVTWVLTAYLLSAAVATPILGRVGDMVGKDRVLVIVMLVFGVGSVIAALAPNIQIMIVARAVQGVGGAVLPLSFGIIRDEVPQPKIAGAISITSAVLGAGGGLSTVLAGPVVSGLSYHWLFWFPVIVIATSAIMARKFIPPSPVRIHARINWLSAVLLASWLVAFLLGVSQAPKWGWLSVKVVGLIAIALVLAAGWIANERRAATPVVDLKMMRIPIVWRVNLIALLYGVGAFGQFAFLPEFVQTPRASGYGLGASVTMAGLIILPSAILTFVFSGLSSTISRWIGVKGAVVLGSTLLIPCFAVLMVPGQHESLAFLSAAFMGAGYGLGFATISNMVSIAVPPEQTGIANGMIGNVRTIGGAVGAAIASSLITANVGASGYPMVGGYNAAWLMLTLACAASALVSLAIPSVTRPIRPKLVDRGTDGPACITAGQLST